MNMNNKNRSASPMQYYGRNNETVTALGLTKREHFAAMALQGMVSVCAYDEQVTSKCRAAVEYADALLKELDK